MLKAILVNYNNTPDWLLKSDLDWRMYDRSESKEFLKEFDQNKIKYTKNMGDADYDKLDFLIEYYDDLPKAFLWGKTNIHKYVDNKTLQLAINNEEFKPLLRQDHAIYSDRFGKVNYYQDGLYYERADSWYFNAGGVDKYHFNNWQEWCLHFGIPQTDYVPFAPGGNYILTKDRVHRYSRDFYEEMRTKLPHAQRPAEAQAAERSYYLLWK